MTNKQINIAIAEACGWKEEEFGPSWYQSYTKMPDYCNDLNAMHEAEKGLPENRKTLFAFMLAQVLDTSPTLDLNDQFLNIHATAIQRAEAFLKTLGKWEDEK